MRRKILLAMEVVLMLAGMLTAQACFIPGPGYYGRGYGYSAPAPAYGYGHPWHEWR